MGWAMAHNFVSEGLQHIGRAGRLGLRQLVQHEQSTGAFNQGAHGAGVTFAFDEVSLLVAWKLAVLDLGRAHMDAQHVGDLAAPVLALAARCALVVGLAQGGDQLHAQLAHGLGVDAVVDYFV